MFRGSQWLGCVLWIQDWCVELWSDAVQLHHRRISIRGWNHLQTFREHWQVWGEYLTNHSSVWIVPDQSQLSIISIWPITTLYCQVSVPAYVDKVLESLLRLMLSKEPDQRPDIATLKHHDWCRKRFPRWGQLSKSKSESPLSPIPESKSPNFVKDFDVNLDQL